MRKFLQTWSIVINKIRQRMAMTGDPEPEQAINLRLTMGIGLIIYFCLPWGEGETLSTSLIKTPSILTLAYYSFAIAIAIAILINPRPSPTRRVMGILLDLVPLSIVMYLAGDESVMLFVLYLWVILGNGFRYGTKYLYISNIVGFTGFCIAIFGGDYWQDPQHKPIALSLLFLIILIPLYSAFLIKKLHTAIASAKFANEAKSRFLANMSHELRTPLNGVIGIADLLGETKLNSQQHEFVEIMRNSANTLLGLIENVLDISKIEAGKITISSEPFDLHQLVNSVIHMQQPMAKTKGINLSYNIDPRTPYSLRGDRQHLRQILINLIGNAIKFTDNGYVKLLLHLVDKNDGNSRIKFEIIDTGIGIPEEYLPTIFEDFTQVTSNNRNTGGTGLGTTISKELVELMRGQIGVKSELGHGTVFWFEIPFALIDDNNLTLPENRVLLLSTEETHLSYQSSLSLWNVNYSWVPSSIKAFSTLLEVAETDAPYTILLVEQACMHEIDPIQYAEMIKAEKSLQNLSLILLKTDFSMSLSHDLSDHYISIIQDKNDKTLLFNALHIAKSISRKGEKIVSLADYYATKGTGALNILIAEDNKVNQQVLQGVLNHAGHTTLLAQTGEQALDILAEQIETVDMLILDMNMPEVSGIEVVKALRYMDTSDRIPVIMLTADATPEAQKSCLEAGANAFLTKPIDSKNLLGRIADLSNARTPIVDTKSVDRNQTSDLVDTTILKELASLGGDENFFNNLVDGFKLDGLKHIQILKQASKDDYLALRESLHALKGSATEMSAMPLAALCLQGEHYKPHQLNQPELISLCEKIELTFHNTIKAIEDMASKSKSSSNQSTYKD